MPESNNSGRALGTIQISAAQAAQLIGVSTRRLQQLVADGWIERPNRGKYTFAAVIQGYLKFLKDDEHHTSKSAEERRVRLARAEEIELRNARQELGLVPRDEVVAYTRRVASAMFDRLDALPARLTLDVDGRRRLKVAVADIRSEIERRLAIMPS